MQVSQPMYASITAAAGTMHQSQCNWTRSCTEQSSLFSCVPSLFQAASFSALPTSSLASASHYVTSMLATQYASLASDGFSMWFRYEVFRFVVLDIGVSCRQGGLGDQARSLGLVFRAQPRRSHSFCSTCGTISGVRSSVKHNTWTC